MDIQDIQWEQYPRVAALSAARSFIERLILKGKRPKTVDAYARAVEDLLTYFSEVSPERVIEADEADLDHYTASLKQRGPKKRGRGGMIEEDTKIRYLTGRKLSDNTIALRVVACRLFYDYLLQKRLRSDPVNPIARGHDGRDGRRPERGPATPRKRLPWVPSDEIWEHFVRHVLLNEDASADSSHPPSPALYHPQTRGRQPRRYCAHCWAQKHRNDPLVHPLGSQ